MSKGNQRFFEDLLENAQDLLEDSVIGSGFFSAPVVETIQSGASAIGDAIQSGASAIGINDLNPLDGKQDVLDIFPIGATVGGYLGGPQGAAAGAAAQGVLGSVFDGIGSLIGNNNNSNNNSNNNNGGMDDISGITDPMGGFGNGAANGQVPPPTTYDSITPNPYGVITRPATCYDICKQKEKIRTLQCRALNKAHAAKMKAIGCTGTKCSMSALTKSCSTKSKAKKRATAPKYRRRRRRAASSSCSCVKSC